jgi:hypothetical protein
MKVVTVPILLTAVALGGCVQTMPSAPAGGPNLSAAEVHASESDLRKDDLLRQLATCESGDSGASERPIYGGRGLYIGRFQFMARTVINWMKEKEGADLSTKEAVDLAHDYDRAASLAKYMIFERDRISEWPLCNRKLGLARQVADIKSMSM